VISETEKQEYYKALLAKSSLYDGIFYVGVKTTGVFCHPTCPARKPKFENCEFYRTAEEALLASFRPCKRCKPLSHPQRVSPLIEKLITAVEANPEKRWKDKDFEAFSIDVSTARRQFKKRFGMTFVQYARSRRMGLAMKNIRCGDSIIESQLASGYESSSGFRCTFSRIMGLPPIKSKALQELNASWLDTPLGPMLAIANEKALYLLEFVDRRGLEREIERLRTRTKSAIIPGKTPIIESIERELNAYFQGSLTHFKTPLFLLGSPFQKTVWQELIKIPSGQTCSYADIARNIAMPKAFRAVANANGANQLAIVIPCHRVINTNGDIGGYGGGITRKTWLLNHEKREHP
jgi:AraC family transcriptional regulator of adaptative response/methylated-DNA-[protein]-cysteine methyltransferase